MQQFFKRNECYLFQKLVTLTLNIKVKLAFKLLKYLF